MFFKLFVFLYHRFVRKLKISKPKEPIGPSLNPILIIGSGPGSEDQVYPGPQNKGNERKDRKEYEKLEKLCSKSSKEGQRQVFLYIRLRTQLKDTSPSSRLIYFELFCNQLVLFPTARTTKRRNLMLVVGNKISVLGGYILPVKSCGFFQGILKAKVL